MKNKNNVIFFYWFFNGYGPRFATFYLLSVISKGKLSLHDHHPLCKSHTYCLYPYLSFPLLSVVLLHISLQILYILLLFSFPALFSACLYVLSFLKPVLLHYILYVSIIGPFSRSLSPLIFLMLCTCFPISLHYRYTLLMLYCISVRLFDSIIPCRLTISLFFIYILPAVFVYLFCSVNCYCTFMLLSCLSFYASYPTYSYVFNFSH